MALANIRDEEKRKAAILLSDYWKERGMPQYDQEWADEYLIEGHKKEIESDEFFVYKEGELIIGIISLIATAGSVAEIRDMVVKPEYREKGYGSKMLQELIEIAKERKIRKLYSLVFPSLLHFYESSGFIKEGTLKNHFKDGEDLVFMSIFL
jgi:N-acetylglutamate synthase-like GNAT family acetyltransferase